MIGVSDDPAKEAPEEERARLAEELGWLDKNLSQYETLSRARAAGQDVQMAHLDEEHQVRADEWLNLHIDEVQTVHRAAGSLVTPDAELNDLRDAVNIGRELVRRLLVAARGSAESS